MTYMSHVSYHDIHESCRVMTYTSHVSSTVGLGIVLDETETGYFIVDSTLPGYAAAASGQVCCIFFLLFLSFCF